jgi:hypothetical protein
LQLLVGLVCGTAGGRWSEKPGQQRSDKSEPTKARAPYSARSASMTPDFWTALTVQISPGKNIDLRFIPPGSTARVLRVELGFTRPSWLTAREPASLPVRVPAVKAAHSPSSGRSLAVTPLEFCFGWLHSLRLLLCKQQVNAHAGHTGIRTLKRVRVPPGNTPYTGCPWLPSSHCPWLLAGRKMTVPGFSLLSLASRWLLTGFSWWRKPKPSTRTG